MKPTRFAGDNVTKAVKWVAALDSHTRPACRIRDSKLYHPASLEPIGHSIPFSRGPGKISVGCRCVLVPVVKEWSELGISTNDKPLPVERSSMFGPVYNMDYYEWLLTTPTYIQSDVLGPIRGLLVSKGGIDPHLFHDSKGAIIRLKQLQAMYPEVFQAACIEW